MSFVGAGRRLAAGLLVLLTTATVLVGVGAGPAQADILTDQIPAPNSGEMVFNSAAESVYLIHELSTSVTKVNVWTRATKNIPVTEHAQLLAVNNKTNKIYVTHAATGGMTVIDGITNQTTKIAINKSPRGIVVNEATNRCTCHMITVCQLLTLPRTQSCHYQPHNMYHPSG
ncbi:YncE family protein [Paenarthrobacter nitroguajacolicus]|uniref:YncE family protein n=1 Tax=Paenarthrobacter nitroguajacolicus TaxID=211146 RepID=UPI0015BEE8F8|nr:hypothetical protein [Paenarthrobacter nitroguajacolicus]